MPYRYHLIDINNHNTFFGTDSHLQSTRITRNSNALIDSIFSNVIDPDIIPGNLTATISDHLT